MLVAPVVSEGHLSRARSARERPGAQNPNRPQPPTGRTAFPLEGGYGCEANRCPQGADEPADVPSCSERAAQARGGPGRAGGARRAFIPRPKRPGAARGAEPQQAAAPTGRTAFPLEGGYGCPPPFLQNRAIGKTLRIYQPPFSGRRIRSRPVTGGKFSPAYLPFRGKLSI